MRIRRQDCGEIKFISWAGLNFFSVKQSVAPNRYFLRCVGKILNHEAPLVVCYNYTIEECGQI